MKNRNTILSLFVIACFVLSPVAQAGGPSRPSPTPTTQDVNVVNTPNVNLVNTPSVNVANFPAGVNVANTASSPVLVRDVDTAARIPFFGNIQLVAVAGEFYKTASVDIPTGKMLVVEFTSAFLIGGDQIDQVSVSDGATGNTHFLVTHSPAGTNSADLTVSEQIRMHATSSIAMGIVRNTANGETDMTGSVTGYLVDVP